MMHDITRSISLPCNLAEAARFLIALDHKAAHFTFQTFDDNADTKNSKLAAVLHGTVQKLGAKLVDLSGQGAGIFVTVNETNLKGREAQDITRVRALFVDLDGAPLGAVLSDTEVPKPHIIVESSSGKWHIYWLVDNVPLGAFRKRHCRLSSGS
jgi:putative DNA primase/helicase